MDMRTDPFAEYAYGKLALKKIGSTDPNFRLFKAVWLGKSNEREVMRVTGATFREALRGSNKGQLCMKVESSEHSALVTAREMDEYDVAHPGRADRADAKGTHVHA